MTIIRGRTTPPSQDELAAADAEGCFWLQTGTLPLGRVSRTIDGACLQMHFADGGTIGYRSAQMNGSQWFRVRPDGTMDTGDALPASQ